MKLKQKFVLFSALILLLPLLASCAAVIPADFARPTDLPPLTENWKEAVYQGLLKKYGGKPDKLKILFLDDPVPAAVALRSKWTFSNKSYPHYGYGGMVAVRQKGLIFDSQENGLYIIDDQGRLQALVEQSDFLFLIAQTPKLAKIEVEEIELDTEDDFGNPEIDYLVHVTPIIGPESAQKLSTFQKAKIKDLPAWQ